MTDTAPTSHRPLRGPRLRAAAAVTLGLLLVPAGAATTAAAGTASTAGARAGLAHDRSTTVSYRPSDAIIANPQRGFYRHTETHYRADGSGYTPLDAATLRGYRDDGVTQILRVFYLEKFAATPTLDPQWLSAVDADLATAREAGVSVIVRFAYAQGGAWPYSPPYGDAPLDVVLSHIEQLGPLLRTNSDVIATVQSGFVGLWGEGYYTDHFAADPADPGVLTEQDWAKRAAVVRALLDELPDDRTLQVRTMSMKQTILGVPTGEEGALTPDQAHDGTDLARVGHHNDCFLASPDDFGTFLSNPLALDEDYLAADTRYVPMGGETCTVNPPKSEWESASTLMARYHFSYLNRDYNQDVLNSWGGAGIEETAKRLGYRFVLEDSTVTAGSPRADGSPTVEVGVRNEGWAAPYNERPARLVLRNDEGTWAVPFTGDDASALPADARDWAPGTTTVITAEPCGVPKGKYDAYLDLPSPDASVQGDPDFSIRTANAGTWTAETGWNDLGQRVTVRATRSTPRECGDLGAVRLDHAAERATLAAITTALDGYAETGEVSGPVLQGLRESLRRAERHAVAGRADAAAAALERAVDRLAAPRRGDRLAEAARADLIGKVQAAIDQLA
ncbi:DUF4832 domain-containing protein [Kineococcus radiotolerans]|uniref:DUF4832 domain-containing protein n=1 Tax=Kineococcus radiotolerans (strain ATCC BAA-149 / DSM 14245 / SRS30216) TaxID=266940 RepID=A6W9Z9_KINRD|nr:DUF4832 domain-containing protein [Kineococcus radiotolerans]ABS03638.1 hypothetical protein Krad_2154 [Kineococcus radiotolerans SRS30216 = ATCC BAA-149]